MKKLAAKRMTRTMAKKKKKKKKEKKEKANVFSYRHRIEY
jgi:hypothetical protein